MSFKKNLEPTDVSLTSFEVYKSFSFTERDSGSGVFAVPLTKGTDSTLFDFSTQTGTSKTISGSIFYKVPNYHMINNLYYKDIRQMRGHIDLIRGVPTGSDAVVKYTSENFLSNTSESLRRPFTRNIHSTATAISLPQKFYGERLKPNSIKLVDNSTTGTFTIIDDGRGNLYDVAFSSSYAKRVPTAQNSGSVVGNVFYDDGLLVITDTGSYSTVGTLEGSDGFTIDFKSTQTIYEREYVCIVGENEFQFTNNKSARVGRSGSVNIDTFPRQEFLYRTDTLDDQFQYESIGFSTGSFDTNGYRMGTEFIGATTHSDFAPYVTAIGLYNDDNDLLTANFPAMPIKNEKELALTFVVRFDTN